ncbi:MAG: glycoside hydrolase family 3 N-terminal domain-containing protein, partial [Bryocella sp.]
MHSSLRSSCVLLSLLCGVPGLLAQTSSGSPRVDRILSQLTLAEKIQLIHGEHEGPETDQGQAGYWPGLPEKGIPSLRMADGPPGVLTQYPSTAPTSTMGLAATFSREDANANGAVVAKDAKALGIDVILQPFVNIERDFTWHRGYDTYGEDPLLSGAIGAAFIQGAQAQGTMAQAKHYIGYDGPAINVFIPAQALHEIYLEPFAAAVNAGVSSVMCGYNKINGAFACGNNHLLNTVLRGELGFKGFVDSDWGATHGTEFLKLGLDLEMPSVSKGVTSRTYFRPDAGQPRATGKSVGFTPSRGIPEEWGAKRPTSPRPDDPISIGMTAALRDGVVTPADVERAAGRILVQMERFGLLDNPPSHKPGAVPREEDWRVVQKTSEDAAVLLKNDGILPLKPADLKKLAVIGPGGGQTIAVGISGEKALGFPAQQISPLAALQAMTTSKIAFAVAN